MSSAAVLPGSPGGLACPVCPACGLISPFCHSGDILWFCREKCGLYRENDGHCWGVNHPVHCMAIIEEITAMIYDPSKKKGSEPVLKS